MRLWPVLLLACAFAPASAETIDAVTFAEKPHQVYISAREASKLLGWPMKYDSVVDLASLRGSTLDPLEPRLSDGTWLVSTGELSKLGAKLTGNTIRFGTASFSYSIGAKRVSVDLKNQLLRAWQGKRLVFEWHVSSGREGKDTPNGDFRAQEKEPMHISKLYGSPMPFSVHVSGNIYIHGSDRFSSTPGSHGCIRLPRMESRNVAEEFYNWIDTGTPIRVRGAFKFAAKAKS